jgi:hypothetical protein
MSTAEAVAYERARPLKRSFGCAVFWGRAGIWLCGLLGPAVFGS